MDLINDPEKKISKVSRRNDQGFLINNDPFEHGKDALSAKTRPARSTIAYILKLWILLFAAYYFGESFFWQFMGRNPGLVQFSNVVAANDTYKLRVIVHDLTEKLVDGGFSHEAVTYGQEQLTSNFTLLSRRLLRRFDRYRIEIIASFNSTITNKTENTSCFVEVAYKNPEDLIEKPFAQSVSESDPQPEKLERATLRKRVLIQMIHDENTYDFSESSLLVYVYHRSKLQANQTNSTAHYYRPRLECSHYWAQDSDLMSFDLLPEDEAVPIFVDFQSTTINRYIWGLKLRLFEKALSDWGINQKWIQNLKSFIADSNSDLLMLLAFVCLCKLAISLTVIPLAKYTTLSDMAEATWSAKRCVLRVASWLAITEYLVQSQASLVLIAVTVYQLLESICLAITKIFSQKKSELTTKCNLFDYLMLPIAAVSVSYATIAFTQSAHGINSMAVLEPLVWIAYGFEAVSLAAPISLQYKLRSSRVFARACPFYELFTALADDLLVLLTKGPTPHLLFAFANDLIFALYTIQTGLFRGKKCSSLEHTEAADRISVVDSLKPKLN